jgi:hypothetical protein
MGIIRFGIPEAEVNYLKEMMSLNIFVEGGTYQGNTAKEMGLIFNKVFTIEKSQQMYDLAKKNLSAVNNVYLLHGDTREFINELLNEYDSILFWLDAHWSGGVTYGEKDECPLLEELKIIFEHKKNYAILIDDARLFLAPPPSPHKLSAWPTLIEILHTLPNDWKMIVFEDVIYLLPQESFTKFRYFLQNKITDQWQSVNNKKETVLRKIFRKIGLCS